MLSLDFSLPVSPFSEALEQSSSSAELCDGGFSMQNHHQNQLVKNQRLLSKSLSFGSSSVSESELLCDAFSSGLEGSVKDSLFAKFLPSNNEEEGLVDAYSSDEFRMYEFKVRRCMRGRSHDWTECPFAHPGEKARRRDPRRFHYSGTACPDFRKGSCRRGDACEFAHGVFECWLHPARYRTQPCKDGRNCKRRVCFFAHTPQQLRLLPGNSTAVPSSSPSKSPSAKNPISAAASLRHISALESGIVFDSSSPRGYVKSNLSTSSPTSTLVGHSQSPPPLSPPLSPTSSTTHEVSWPIMHTAYQKTLNYEPSSAQTSLGYQGVRRHPSISIPVSQSSVSTLSTESSCNSPSSPFQHQSSPKNFSDLVNTLQNLDLNSGGAVNSSVVARPWLQTPSGYVNSPPRTSNLRHCSYSLPCTPTKSGWETSIWDVDLSEEPQQRVESGRDLRAKIYGRLTREASESSASNADSSPDLAWVNDLLK